MDVTPHRYSRVELRVEIQPVQLRPEVGFGLGLGLGFGLGFGLGLGLALGLGLRLGLEHHLMRLGHPIRG